MTQKIVSRPVKMPDMVRLNRYERTPELGPNLLFFSGGSALTEASRFLKKFTHNSVHLVTPYDSGGSSAVLRQAFKMPAIGDLRSRLMALADETIRGNPEIFALFAHRFPKQARREDLQRQLQGMIDGKDPMVSAIKNPMRRLIRTHLHIVQRQMSDDFDLCGASIGNLILAGGYLNNDRQLDPVIFMFSRLVNVLGQVSPIVDETHHLAVDLEDGQTIIGQHLMTGKEGAPITSPIKRMYLVRGLDDPRTVHSTLSKAKRKLIKNAELICYPPGSFYSSLLANLMSLGVGDSIAANRSPKVYVPNLGYDPEQLGLSTEDTVFTIIDYLRAGTSSTRGAVQPSDFINFVLIDSKNGMALKRGGKARLQKAGIDVIDTRLVTPSSAPYYEPSLLVSALLSLT